VNANSDLELVIAELKQPEDSQCAEQSLFALEDEGRIELIRMALLVKDEGGEIDIQIVPARQKHRRSIKHAAKADLEGLFAWVLGSVLGGNAGQEARLAAGRTATLALSDAHIDELAKSLGSGSTAVLALVEGEVVGEALQALRPLMTNAQRFRMRVEKSSELEHTSQGGEHPV
jgi:uncharacterized membrane protein